VEPPIHLDTEGAASKFLGVPTRVRVLQVGGISEWSVRDTASRLFISCDHDARRPNSTRVEDCGNVTVPHDRTARPGP
jgi:hypothetical protein